METTKLLSEKLAKLNLSNFVKSSQGKKSLYIIPDNIKDNEKEQKIFRRNIRKEKTRICFKIVSEYKETSKLSENTLKEFNSFYKKYFLVQDYSIANFTNVNEQKESNKLYEIALEIVKMQISAKK